ncbi:unnamed protein product [Chondrus crispus]|uniref:Uncharacterized protein n=1 Tax=Chondrus crispus TaxID=2769 RepID=R7Q370_CHOCR|nr:unnamed protein product [Chondrus crispus]CDF32353.1 unnamed protein product [Chondrus crispus]|eukprot:XP_005712018.1 unnamed protein product [Chondrus crispus]
MIASGNFDLPHVPASSPRPILTLRQSSSSPLRPDLCPTRSHPRRSHASAHRRRPDSRRNRLARSSPTATAQLRWLGQLLPLHSAGAQDLLTRQAKPCPAQPSQAALSHDPSCSKAAWPV